MKAFLESNGNTKFAKEPYHINYLYTNVENQINQSLLGKWVGMKFIIYNVNQGDTTIAKMEMYVDAANTNTWIKVDEKADTGG
jgi:hypothetical protein